MRVLIDCVSLTVGGGVQVAIGLLAGLQRQSGTEWSAVVPHAMRSALPPFLAEDARVTYVSRRSQADRVWLTPFLKRLEQRFAPDLVFSVFGPPFFRARAPHLVGFALPHLIYERDSDMPPQTLSYQLRNLLRRKAFRQATHIVVETATAKARVAERIGIAREQISVIPNGPNPLLRPLPDGSACATRPFTILVPSAYYWHKNLEILPAVAAAMRRHSPALDFVFRLMLPRSSKHWCLIKGHMESLGIDHRIDTLGEVKITDLARAYHEASAVYLPTLREISPAVYPESFLFRRPLVTTDMDFARELCGPAADFVHPRDPEDAAARLVELAASPEKQARLVAAGSRQLVAAYPTAEAKFRMQLDIMARVAESNGRGVVPICGTACGSST